jgi:hypothetical protein
VLVKKSRETKNLTPPGERIFVTIPEHITGVPGTTSILHLFIVGKGIHIRNIYCRRI